MSCKLLQTVVDIFPSFVAVSVIFLKIHLAMHVLELLNSSIAGLGRCVVPQLLDLLPFVMSWAIPVHHSRIREHWKTPGIHTQMRETEKWSCELGAGLLCNFPCRKILNKMQ